MQQRVVVFFLVVNGLSIVESWLLVLDAEFAIDSCDDALYLAHCEHTSEQGVARVVSVVRLIEYASWLIGECHTVVYSHWQSASAIALAVLLCLFEDAAQLDEVATASEV